MVLRLIIDNNHLYNCSIHSRSFYFFKFYCLIVEDIENSAWQKLVFLTCFHLHICSVLEPIFYLWYRNKLRNYQILVGSGKAFIIFSGIPVILEKKYFLVKSNCEVTKPSIKVEFFKSCQLVLHILLFLISRSNKTLATELYFSNFVNLPYLVYDCVLFVTFTLFNWFFCFQHTIKNRCHLQNSSGALSFIRPISTLSFRLNKKRKWLNSRFEYN